MSGVMWKARMDSVLSGVGRDVSEIVREAKVSLAGLDTMERLVLFGLVAIGLFYIVLMHFQRREDEQRAGSQFVGLLFVMAAVAAGIGWTLSDRTA